MARKLTKAELEELEQRALAEEYLAYSQQVSSQVQEDRARSSMFDNVSSRVIGREEPSPFSAAPATPEYDPENDTSLIDRAQGSIQRMTGSALATASDSDNPFISTLGNFAGMMGNFAQADPNTIRDAASGAAGIEASGDLLSAGQANTEIANRAQAERNAQRSGVLGTIERWVDETAGDITDSPSSLASLVGGPFAAIGGADVYAQTYAQARASGMTKEQARLQANTQAGIETGMSVIPAGKLLDKTPFGKGVKRVLANEFGTIASKTFAGTVKTGVGEALEEGATQVLQTEANRALAAIAEDPREKAYLESQLPASTVEYFNQVVRAARAGGVAGTAFGAPASHFEAIAQAGKQAQETIDAIHNNDLNIPNPSRAPESSAWAPIQDAAEPTVDQRTDAWLRQPLAKNDGVRQEVASARSPDAAALRREAERTAAGVVADAGPQDAQDFISSPVGAVSRANTIPTSPEAIDVADELAFNTRQAEAQAARAEAAAEAQKIVDSQEKAKTKAQNKQTAAKRRAYLAEVQKTVVDLPPAERAAAITEAIAAYNPDASQTAPMAPQAALVSDAPTVAPSVQVRQDARIAEETQAREEGIKQLMAADPTLTRQEAEQSFSPSTTPETEADIRAAYSKPLNSVSGQPSAAQPTGPTANEFITAVADRVKQGNDRQANVVSKLIRDGKLVVVNNAEEIAPGEDPRVRGAYDPDKGVFYINAAHMDRDNPTGSLLSEVAVHEADHAARLSQNPDATSPLSGLMGRDNFDRFVKRLKEGTDSIAQAARKGAEESGENPNDYRYKLELAAYAMQEAAKQYADGSKGLPALWRGVISAARTTAQKYIPGMDVNMKDLGYIGQKVLEGVASTESSLKQNNKTMRFTPLNTILSRESTGFDQAQREGITYLSKDGAEKFVISDADSKVKPGAVKRLLNGEALTLGQVLDHPELYEQIPEMANLPVSTYDVPGSSAFATYYPDPSTPGEGEIVLSRALTEGKTGVDVREAILHEAQHHVQNQDAQRRVNFFNSATDRSPEEMQLVERAKEAGDKSAKSTRNFLDKMNRIIKQVDSPAVKRAMTSVIFDRNMTDYGKARELAGYVADEGLMEYLDEATQVVEDMDAYNKLVPELNSARESYFENITEQEAFFTQDNANNPNPVINPEQGSFVRPVTRGKGGVRLNSIAPTTIPRTTVPYKPSLAQTVIDKLAGQFLWHGAGGKDLGLLQEWQKGFASNVAARASTFFHQLKAGQEKLANDWVKTGKAKNIKDARKDVSKMITDRFTAIGNIPDKRRRDSMIARFVQQYPELAPLQQAINDVNALTDDIIASRMRDSKPLSADELAQIKYMIANKSKYVTGIYAAFQGKEGKKYVDKLYADIATANELLAKGKAIPPGIKAEVVKYRAALKFVIQNDVAVSDPEHINSLSLDAVRDLYNMWRPTLTPDAEGLQNSMGEDYDEQVYKDTMSAVIQNGVKNADQAKFEQLGSALLEQLLRQTATGTLARYMRGAKMDTSILEHKTDIPQELKDLYGEVTDLPALLAITMAKQGELAAQSKLLADIKEFHTGDIVIEGNAEEMSKPENAAFTEKLEGEKWGPLEGMMIKPAQLSALTDYRDTFLDLTTATSLASQDPSMLSNYLTSRAGKVMSRTGKAAKVATVVTSPINMVMNAMGSAASATMAGGVRPDYLWRGLKLAAELTLESAFPNGIGGKFVPANNPDRDLYFRMNVGESAQAQNMRRAPTDLLRKLVQGMETEGKREITLKTWTGLKNLMGTGWDTLMEFFALSDAWIKFPIMLQRANQLEKRYAANGETKSIEDIYKEASDYAQDIGMSYNRTAPILRAAEQTSFLGTFMPYLQSTFRSIGYGAKHSLDDIAYAINAKPEARLQAATMAARSVAGVMAVLASPQIYQAIANALNDDEEEEAIEAEKGMMEDRFKYGNLVAMGKNAEGKNLYFQGSRIDARGPATDVLRILTSDADADTKWEAVKENLKGLWILPGMFESMAKLGFDVLTDEKVKNRETKTERQLPLLTEKMKSLGTAVGVDYSTMESAIEVMDRFNPAGFNYFDPKAEKSVQGSRAETGAAALVALGGYRLAAADPEAAALYAGLDYKDLKKDGRAQIAANLGKVGPEAALAEFRDQAAKERRAIAKAGDVYEAMIKTGMSKQEADKIFKDLKIFDTTDMNNIRNKTYEENDEEWAKEYSTMLSAQSLQKKGEKDEKNKENIEALQELIDELGYKKMKENR